jgi:hypothetical protein
MFADVLYYTCVLLVVQGSFEGKLTWGVRACSETVSLRKIHRSSFSIAIPASRLEQETFAAAPRFLLGWQPIYPGCEEEVRAVAGGPAAARRSGKRLEQVREATCGAHAAGGGDPTESLPTRRRLAATAGRRAPSGASARDRWGSGRAGGPPPSPVAAGVGTSSWL